MPDRRAHATTSTDMDPIRSAAQLGIIRIDDPNDARIAAYRDIRERDLVGREGRFVAEGEVVLAALFAGRRFEAEAVLVLDNRLEGLPDTLVAAPAGLPMFVVPADVM